MATATPFGGRPVAASPENPRGTPTPTSTPPLRPTPKPA
jgi:hypothetical protein